MQTDLSFRYERDSCLDDNRKYVKKISFATSRYGKYSETITFKREKTEKEAVRRVEKWLSKPITKKYFNTQKDDFLLSVSYPMLEPYGYRVRGDLLVGCIYIEEIELYGDNDPNHVFIEAGS